MCILKTPLIIIFYIGFITIGIAQNRKDIINDIRKYFNETVYGATYETDNNSLKKFATEFFVTNGFIVKRESDTSVLFYKKTPFPCKMRNKFEITIFKTCYCDAFVTLLIYEDKSKKNINISTILDKDFNNINTPDSYWSGHPAYIFDEAKLRKHLYTIYYNDFIEMPPELVKKIDVYNASYPKRKKLLAGKNY